MECVSDTLGGTKWSFGGPAAEAQAAEGRLEAQAAEGRLDEAQAAEAQAAEVQKVRPPASDVAASAFTFAA